MQPLASDMLYKLESINEISGATYFTVKLITTTKKIVDVKFFKSATTGLRWQVLGYNFLPAKAWKKGIRLIGVVPMQSGANAIIGDTLIAEH